MYFRHDIEFKTVDNIFLRGWYYSPEGHEGSFPGIIMTHGFSALKEHYLNKFAEVFVENGMCVLIYDNRNFGASEGKPRLEVDPLLQVRDMRDAITFMQAQKEVDAEKIGLWGTSFSGGNVLAVAATDKRVHCIVAQVPFVSGHHASLKAQRPDIWEVLKKKYAMDRKARVAGKPPMMTPVVSVDEKKSAVIKESSAYHFFTSVPMWENLVTLRSVENSGDYHLSEYIPKISPVPLLFIVAEQDTVCIADLALRAFEKALPPKKLVKIAGDHFGAYNKHFEKCAAEACDWFKQGLTKKNL